MQHKDYENKYIMDHNEFSQNDVCFYNTLLNEAQWLARIIKFSFLEIVAASLTIEPYITRHT